MRVAYANRGARPRRTSRVVANAFELRDIPGLAEDLWASRGTTLAGAKVSTWANSTRAGVSGGSDATQGTDAYRPTYSAYGYGGRPSIDFVRSSSTRLALALNLASASRTVFLQHLPTSTDTTTATVLDFQTGRFALIYPQAGLVQGWDGAAGQNYGAVASGQQCLTWRLQTTASLRRNGAVITSGIAYTKRVFGGAAQRLGAAYNDASFYSGSVESLVIYQADLSTMDVRRVERHLAMRRAASSAAPVLTVVAASDKHDSAAADVISARLTLAASLARTRVTTTDDSITLRAAGNASAYSTLAVFVDGVYHSDVPVSNSGAIERIPVGLGSPGVSKTVDIYDGARMSALTGTALVGVESASATVVAPTNPASRLVVYGDSVSVGRDATMPNSKGWVALARLDYPGGIATEGYSGRSLYIDAYNSTVRAALVAQIVALGSQCTTAANVSFWLAIGLNDYLNSLWSLASFTTAYGALVDDLHAALPSATIYAQTLIAGTTTAANVHGDTRAAYNAAISGLTAGRAWLTVVDASAFLTTGDLSDGIHPTTAGHALYKAAVKTALGY